MVVAVKNRGGESRCYTAEGQAPGPGRVPRHDTARGVDLHHHVAIPRGEPDIACSRTLHRRANCVASTAVEVTCGPSRAEVHRTSRGVNGDNVGGKVRDHEDEAALLLVQGTEEVVQTSTQGDSCGPRVEASHGPGVAVNSDDLVCQEGNHPQVVSNDDTPSEASLRGCAAVPGRVDRVACVGQGVPMEWLGVCGGHNS